MGLVRRRFCPHEVCTSTTLAVCGSAGSGIAGFGAGPAPDNETTVGDYIPHHQPFEYYLSSTNQHHVRPSSVSKIGKDDGAVNHQYDLSDFFAALKNGNLPVVSFLKAPSWADGHPGYSDPLDEQKFVVNTIDALMASDEWQGTAVVILYDDSDGWYDHTMDPVVNQSGITGGLDDFLSAPGFCGTTPGDGLQGRCGYGPRQPLLVISPWAKENYVSHKITDQSSVLRFIEDNFLDGERIANSNDAKAGTLDDMFDFDDKDSDGRWSREKDELHHRTLLLDPNTGEQVDFDKK